MEEEIRLGETKDYNDGEDGWVRCKHGVYYERVSGCSGDDVCQCLSVW